MRARREFGSVASNNSNANSSSAATKFGTLGSGRGTSAFGTTALGPTRSSPQPSSGASKWASPSTGYRSAGRAYGREESGNSGSGSSAGSSSTRTRLLLGLLVFVVACTPLYFGSVTLGKRGWTKSLSRRALGSRVSSWGRAAASFGIPEDTLAAESSDTKLESVTSGSLAVSAGTKGGPGADKGAVLASESGSTGSTSASDVGLSPPQETSSQPPPQEAPKKPKQASTEKFVLELKGSVFSRLEQICAALWYLAQQPQVPGIPLAVAWRADSEVLGASIQDVIDLSSVPSYSDSSANPGTGGAGSLNGIQWSLLEQIPDFSDSDSGYTKHEAKVLSGDCQPGPSINPQNAPVGITFWSLPGSLEPLKDPSADGRDSTGAVRKCVAGLRPAQAVSDLVAKEREKIGAGLKDAFVLHLEAPLSGQSPEDPGICEACPGDASSRVLCAARHISRLFLCNQTSEVLLVTESAEDAASLQDVFHSSRSPILPSYTSERATSQCPSPTSFVGQGTQSIPGLEPARLRHCLQLYMAEMVLARDFSSRGFLHFHPTPAARFLCSLSGDSASGGSALAQEGGAGGRLKVAADGEVGARQGWGAETPVSSITYSCPSSGASFSIPICRRPALPPLSSYKYSSNTIVDEELGVVYCGVDRAASSTVKTILRTLKGLSPFPTQPWKVHDRHVNGLRYLDSPEYTGVNEAKGIRQMTRRDFIKFVFVRNPFYRALSLYLDVYKFTSGSQKKDNYAMALARGSANWQLFRDEYAALFSIKTIPGRVKGHVQLTYAWTKQLSFDQFLTLAVAVIRSTKRAEPRIALQTELCRLDSIKYDHVGRVESFEEDAKTLRGMLIKRNQAQQKYELTLRLNSSSFDSAIQKGNRLQRTVDMVVSMYSKETAKMVYDNYKPDFLVDLNGIYFQAPEPITAMLE